ncbi:MAG: hypothetical protein LBU88_02130 [Treponema sp.]|jgi:hypothetical protein|nr:hypothetical protein [Treponema sp.]
MADPGLVQALDYILNKSNESTIEVLAEAVVRRRRNMTVFSAIGGLPDPDKMANEITEKINEGLNFGMEGMRQSIREMIFRIIKEHAPELSENQMNELSEAWLPDMGAVAKSDVPQDVMLSMIDQFVTFSNGNMQKSVDENLRQELGAWPERYWNAFPPVVRQIITDYLKNKITEKDFRSKISLAFR